MFGMLTLFLTLGFQAAQQLPGTSIAPLKLPGGMYGARRINYAPPQFPREARLAHVQGVVALRTLIGPDGHVRQVTPLSGPEMLRESAMEGVRQWTFEPLIVQGSPVAVNTLVCVDYSFELQEFSGFRIFTPSVAARVRVSGIDPSAGPTGINKTGVVRLSVFIGHSGEVLKTQVREGPKDLARIAQDAVAGWKYAPYTSIAGTKDQVETEVAFDFQ